MHSTIQEKLLTPHGGNEWQNISGHSTRARQAHGSSCLTSGRAVPWPRRSTSRSIPPGWVEHDPLEIWRRTQEVIAEALERGDLHAYDLAAVGITNQRETTVVWDPRPASLFTTLSSGRTRG